MFSFRINYVVVVFFSPSNPEILCENINCKKCLKSFAGFVQQCSPNCISTYSNLITDASWITALYLMLSKQYRK